MSRINSWQIQAKISSEIKCSTLTFEFKSVSKSRDSIGLSKTDGDEMQSEYFVPYKYSIKAMKAVSIECYLIGKMKAR